MNEALHYRRFTAGDIDAAQALVVQSGWNQTADDWRIFLDLGEVIAVENATGRVIATAATLPHGAHLGWISMVLVDLAHRRQGIATNLLKLCIDTLQRDARIPVLDATPAGREVYLRLGFRDGPRITRWQADLPRRQIAAALSSTADPVAASTSAMQPSTSARRPSTSALRVRPIEAGDWHAIAALDARACGTDRVALLQRLHVRSREFACVAIEGDALRGFALGRDGNRATYLGPIVADSEPAARALLQAMIANAAGPVFIDALDAHASLRTWLEANGFAVQRPYVRMALGELGTADPSNSTSRSTSRSTNGGASGNTNDDSTGAQQSIWSIAGPELG